MVPTKKNIESQLPAAWVLSKIALLLLQALALNCVPPLSCLSIQALKHESGHGQAVD
jgi:hypothetical protein